MKCAASFPFTLSLSFVVLIGLISCSKSTSSNKNNPTPQEQKQQNQPTPQSLDESLIFTFRIVDQTSGTGSENCIENEKKALQDLTTAPSKELYFEIKNNEIIRYHDDMDTAPVGSFDLRNQNFTIAISGFSAGALRLSKFEGTKGRSAGVFSRAVDYGPQFGQCSLSFDVLYSFENE